MGLLSRVTRNPFAGVQLAPLNQWQAPVTPDSYGLGMQGIGQVPFAAPGIQPLDQWQAPQTPDTSGLSTQGFAPIKPQPTMWQRMGQAVNNIDAPTWFGISGALLDAAWHPDQVGQAVAGAGQALADQGKRRFQDEQIGWARQDHADKATNEADRKSRWEQAIQSTANNPQLQAAIRAAGWSGNWEALLGDQVVSAADQSRLDMMREQNKTDAERWQKDYELKQQNLNLDRARIQLGQKELGADRYSQAQDAQLLSAQTAATAQLQSVGLPQLQSLQDTINRAGGLDNTGKVLSYNDRIKLGRIMNGSTAERQNLEVWRAQVLGPALEQLRGLGAMSEKEMQASLNAFSNPDMTLGAAKQLINQKLKDAQRKIATSNAMQEFYRSSGGISGVNNKQGENFSTFLSRRLKEQGLDGPVMPPPDATASTTTGKVGEEGDLRSALDSVLSGVGKSAVPTLKTPNSDMLSRVSQIPAQDRAELRRRMNDPAAVAAFESHYGPGSADAALWYQGVRRR